MVLTFFWEELTFFCEVFSIFLVAESFVPLNIVHSDAISIIFRLKN